MPEPLISCVVPVRDGARYLDETLDSILGQTHRPLEVVVVDDGSADGSAELAAARGPRVRVIRQAHRGPPAARNAGLRAARGELVAFCDADDLWEPDKLEVQLAHLARHPDADAVFCALDTFWEDGLEAEEELWRGRGRTQGILMPQTMLARRRVFDRVGDFDERFLHADTAEWMARARDAGTRFEISADVLAHRRRHAGGHSRRPGTFDDYLHFVKDRLDRRRTAAG